jgi:hypothetical protein
LTRDLLRISFTMSLINRSDSRISLVSGTSSKRSISNIGSSLSTTAKKVKIGYEDLVKKLIYAGQQMKEEVLLVKPAVQEGTATSTNAHNGVELFDKILSSDIVKEMDRKDCTVVSGYHWNNVVSHHLIFQKLSCSEMNDSHCETFLEISHLFNDLRFDPETIAKVQKTINQHQDIVNRCYEDVQTVLQLWNRSVCSLIYSCFIINFFVD